MRTAEAVLQEYEDAAWHIAEVPLDETRWDQERRTAVVALIERGDHIVDRLVGRASSGAGSIRWSESDSPVMLARAFGRMHQRLVVAVRQAGAHADDVTVVMELAGQSALPMSKGGTGRVDAVAAATVFAATAVDEVVGNGPACAGPTTCGSVNGTRRRVGIPPRSHQRGAPSDGGTVRTGN